ncbi:PREDICTED: GPI mannosyltransferase 3 [Vollenhovia emeryi]|uniref:GPI mannosyltransferase 3 n=1 Tax=Vollenhovia emeryi TaxID=411798 RepID=UPI0005F535C1|nr:PREDICTED: GPI mannosyltransferase 3 [Vollenhovia emeryi]XP_011865111.1 PREDICTED: GPI mannosyltransferase 3 [Vollenhovia emeryi]
MRLPRRLELLSLLILWRLIGVFLVRTVHVPDEYWQSLEVAHRLAFGYGHLTWEWTTMIRSYAYPFLISILYRTLAVLSLDSALLLTTLPRVLQAVLVAYADYRFYMWTKSKWMLVSLCLNWYWYYCATRTLINSVETACTVIALSMFPWREGHVQGVRFLWIVGLLCMARPTAAIMWLPLCLYHILTSLERRVLLARYVLICLTCAAISVSIDSHCYGTFVITPWRFFRLNVLGNVGSTYGVGHALWYIYAALPVLLGLHVVPFLLSCCLIARRSALFPRESIMLLTIGWTLLVYSLLSHKEFRFILPLLPLLIYTSFACLNRLTVRVTADVRKGLVALLVCSNVMTGLFFSTIHQRGTLAIMESLRGEITAADLSSTDTLILTPCHSTPLYSHLHVNTTIRFLTCEPNLDNVEDYVDEADRFFANATAWLDDNYVKNSEVALPTYVIVFDSAASKIPDFLRTYTLIVKVFHTYFPERNYGENILLYKRM